jgi:hypothetical protein
LAEVVGLSSPDFRDACVHALPAPAPCPASSIEFDLEALLDSGAHSDMMLLAEDEEGGGSVCGFPVHRAILVSRCPFFAATIKAMYALKEDGDAANISEEDRKRVAMVFGNMATELGTSGKNRGYETDTEGRVVVREINKSLPEAVHAFLIFIYTDRLDAVKTELAIDVLQMACVYGLAKSRLAHECERLLRIGITPENAIDTLCVAHQLSRDDLKQFALEYIVENLCKSVNDVSSLTDALMDFPILGVDILRAVASRIRSRGAEDMLKRVMVSSNTTVSATAHYVQPQYYHQNSISTTSVPAAGGDYAIKKSNSYNPQLQQQQQQVHQTPQSSLNSSSKLGNSSNSSSTSSISKINKTSPVRPMSSNSNPVTTTTTSSSSGMIPPSLIGSTPFTTGKSASANSISSVGGGTQKRA